MKILFIDLYSFARGPEEGALPHLNKRRVLDPHHIISRAHARKTEQLDLITNPGNIVYICRKCHNQTTASKSRYKIMKEKQSPSVEVIEIEVLKAEIKRMKEKNRISIRSIRKLANAEIEDKNTLRDIEIHILEWENQMLKEENNSLKNNVDVLNSLSFEHHVSNEVQRLSKEFDIFFRRTKKSTMKTKKEFENEVRKTLTGIKKTGKSLRKKVGL